MRTRNIPRIPFELATAEELTGWKDASEEGTLISGIRISGEDVTGSEFYKLDITASRFERSRLLNCSFEKASFVDVIFENCDFSNSHFSMAYFHRCEFHDCKCLGTDFHEAVLKHVKITGSTLKYANLNGALLEYVEMEQCDLTETSLSEIKHKNWSAAGCQFVRTNFFHTKLRNFDFTKSDLEDIIISDTLEEIRGAKITAVQALEAARLLDMRVE